jgi:diguanylate cyclase (GGDEF)-like protein/PAS domain S-box-containing protein
MPGFHWIRRPTLRTKLAWGATLIMRKDLTRSVGDAQSAVIASVARDLDEKIELRRSALSLQAAVLGARVSFEDIRGLDDFFETRPLLTSLFETILIADTSGALVYDAPSLPGRRGRSIADREYFKQVIATGKPVISTPLPGKTTGQAGVNFAVPILGRNDKVLGVLIGVLYLHRPNFLSDLGNSRIGKSGYFALMSKGPRPVMVMHMHRERIMENVPVHLNEHVARALQGFEGTVESVNSQGLSALFSYRSLSSVPWVLASAYPTAEAYATLRGREREVIAAGCAIALLSGVLTWLLVGRLLQPLTKLRDAMAMHLSSPELPLDTVDAHSSEVAELAQAYTDLMEQRQSAEMALRLSERRLLSIADNMPALVGYVDKDEVYRFANQKYRAIFGVELHQILGKTVREVVGDAGYGSIERQIAGVLRGEPQHFERARAGAQGRFHLLVDYIPDVAGDGSVVGFFAMTVDITARKTAELQLVHSESMLRAITDHLPALVTHVDAEKRYTFVNAHAGPMFGLDPKAMIGRTVEEVCGPGLYSHFRPHLEEVLDGHAVTFETDGDVGSAQFHGRHYLTHYIPEFDTRGRTVGCFALAFDLSERKAAELALAQKERMIRAVTDNLPVLISYVDRREVVGFANATFKKWLGIDPADAIGRPLRDVLGPTLYEPRKGHLEHALTGMRAEFEVASRLQNSERYLQNVYIPDLQPDGSVAGVFMLSTDITVMMNVQRQLDGLARVDSLTGLPNRRQFDEKLNEALVRSRRNRRPLALIFLDVDNFKAINDTLGHAAGDAVLREFGSRLRSTMRATDIAARLAGDEFVVVLEGLNTKEEAELVAQKVIDAIRREFILDTTPLMVTTSMGVAFAPQGNVTAEAMMKCADEALYKAKRAGRDGFRLLPCEPPPPPTATN